MNITPFTKLIESPKASVVIRILLALFALFLAFWAGMGVGYRKAEFSYRFSDRYFRAFDGRGPSPAGLIGLPDVDVLMSGHGAAGKVLSVKLPTLLVSDRNGVEKTIIIDGQTVIKNARNVVASTTIGANDFVVVIGNPDGTGGITAKLIRIMPDGSVSTSSIPANMMPPTGRNMMYVQQ